MGLPWYWTAHHFPFATSADTSTMAIVRLKHHVVVFGSNANANLAVPYEGFQRLPLHRQVNDITHEQRRRLGTLNSATSAHNKPAYRKTTQTCTLLTSPAACSALKPSLEMYSTRKNNPIPSPTYNDPHKARSGKTGEGKL
jgi:hypothetical protein